MRKVKYALFIFIQFFIFSNLQGQSFTGTEKDSSYYIVRGLLSLVENGEAKNGYQLDTIIMASIDSISPCNVEYDFDFMKIYRLYAVIPGESSSLEMDVYDKQRKLKGTASSSKAQQVNKEATYVGVSLTIERTGSLSISVMNDQSTPKVARLLIYSIQR